MANRAVDLVITYRVIKLLVTPFNKQEAFKQGIIDKDGNVGIGTSATSDADDNATFAIPTATLYVKGGASAGGTCDVVIRGGSVAGEMTKEELDQNDAQIRIFEYASGQVTEDVNV